MIDRETTECLDLLICYEKAYFLEKKSLPYHINVIDELHAGENAHSRILTQLLQYTDGGNLTILKSFLDFVCRPATPFSVSKPTITCEENRIDCRVRDDEYTIIIENKIHYAVDQDLQLERYIENEDPAWRQKDGNQNKKIWVVYLTRDGEKNVGHNSLTPAARNYLEYTDENSGRFFSRNYRDDILPWLKTNVLPQCRIKDKYLITALTQYVDHLEGMFDQREGDRYMYEALEKLVEDKLSINNVTLENYERLKTITEALNSLHNSINTIIARHEEDEHVVWKNLDLLPKYLFKQMDDYFKKRIPNPRCISYFNYQVAKVFEFKPKQMNLKPGTYVITVSLNLQCADIEFFLRGADLGSSKTTFDRIKQDSSICEILSSLDFVPNTNYDRYDRLIDLVSKNKVEEVCKLVDSLISKLAPVIIPGEDPFIGGISDVSH
jgi:hypothetical protein